ncbi:hypothetical protein N7522_006398 [Penicillium canescens]|nr:hypothetical protein N7522_006398 [Penicillium canescens]
MSLGARAGAISYPGLDAVFSIDGMTEIGSGDDDRVFGSRDLDGVDLWINGSCDSEVIVDEEILGGLGSVGKLPGMLVFDHEIWFGLIDSGVPGKIEAVLGDSGNASYRGHLSMC